jgi:lysophospholipase L1-like esterase
VALVIAIGSVSALAYTNAQRAKGVAAAAGSYTPPLSATDHATDAPPVVAIVGDSYTAGTQLDSGEQARWPALLAADLGLQVSLFSRNGVGYVTSSESGVNFVERAASIAGNPDVIIVFGSRNDQQGYDAVRAASSEAYSVISQNHPDAAILVVGPPWVNSKPPAWLVQARDATRDAAADTGATYVDPVTEGWFNEGGLIGEDGVHPNDAGHARIAERIRPHLQAILDSL